MEMYISDKDMAAAKHSELDIGAPSDWMETPRVPANHASLERKALLKLDFFLIPIMGLYFFLSFLDRSNLGNVRIDYKKTFI